MSENEISPDVISLLEEAVESKIENFEVILHNNDATGQGYLGEMIFVSLRNKSTNKMLHLVVKKSLPTNSLDSKNLMETTYNNEIHFYKRIWPELKRFQRSFLEIQPFNNIAKYYVSSGVCGKEKLVLANLKYLGYQMFPRDGTFDDKHVKSLMKLFGHFHGVSASFREYNPEDYQKLTQNIKDSYACLMKLEVTSKYMINCMEQLNDRLDDERIKEKLKKYIEKAPTLAVEATKYEGKNPVINHGDCWSNNMMFKYNNDGTIADIILLDFQLIRSSSVVCDLSYLLYSGVTKEIFSKLDYYLKIYHDSFSNTIRQFCLDPSKMFSFEDLKNEWKDHCAYGFGMSQMLWPTKLAKSYEKRNIVEVTELADGSPVTVTGIVPEKVNEICLDLVNHLYENDFL